MRVLFITNFHQLYGANRSLLSVIENFKENGHEVCLILPRKGDYSQELEKKGINHMVIPYFSQLFYYKKALPYLALPFLAVFTLCMMPYIEPQIQLLQVLSYHNRIYIRFRYLFQFHS